MTQKKLFLSSLNLALSVSSSHAQCHFQHHRLNLLQCDEHFSRVTMKLRLRSLKNFIIFTICGCLALFIIQSITKSSLNVQNSQKYLKNWLQSVQNLEKSCRDWHDYEFIDKEKKRVGPGEHGKALNLSNSRDIEENEKFIKETGLAVIVSNKISVNRSIPDQRNVECQSVQYPAHLPNVSVIIIFYNEAKSVLLRTVHAVVNRTPKELLHEVILVNDKSSNEELYEPLQSYVEENFNGLVKIKNLKERKGLIVTRLEGAEIATGEILVFFE